MNSTITLSNKTVIRVINLSKTFGEIKAVHDLSFDVNKGEIFGFLGPNGAGKTTTGYAACVDQCFYTMAAYIYGH